jgi:hypothetical protein
MRDIRTSVCASGPIFALHSTSPGPFTSYLVLKPVVSRS